MKCCLKIKNGCLETQTKHPLNILEGLGISNHCSVPIHNDYGFEIPNHCLHMVQLLKDVLGLQVSHIFIVLWFSTLMTKMGVLQLIKVRRKCIFGLYILGFFWFGSKIDFAHRLVLNFLKLFLKWYLPLTQLQKMLKWQTDFTICWHG